MARKGQGIYKGFTTDKSKVHFGDHVAIGCSSCHIELVAEPPHAGGCRDGRREHVAGGGGSQYNGGGVYSRSRSDSEIVGYLLVRFP